MSRRSQTENPASPIASPIPRRGRLALVVAGALVLAGCQHGADGFNDGSSSDEAPDVAMVRSLMEGLGAVDAKTEAKIEYKPRAPLAMPASMDSLPQPEEEKVVANWPEQDDAQLKKIQDIYRDKADIDKQGRSNIYQSRGIKELAGNGANRDIQAEIRQEEKLDDARMKPNELNQRVGVAKEQTGIFDANGEPVRRYLIEPPTEYSKPSPDAPMAEPTRTAQQPQKSDIELLMDGRSARTLR
ncbi:hypothetical protein [Stappia sp.]|uniref:hypothetical protein n=1 Tax=Stappia sp. TaxID=1870903 RepID=UPI003D141C9D